MRKITLTDVRNYLVGNFKYYYSKFVDSPLHIQEQLAYRYEKCKNDCIPQEGCIICKCPPEKKHFLRRSCNPERFPDLMGPEEWEEFKIKHNVTEL